MLTSLHIKNFALIESLHLDFSSNMTVITGETGAGKSIMIDALGLTLGERADTGVIRHGTDKADITACFQLSEKSPALEWLKQNDLEEEHDCILRRIIAKEGRSKCWINGHSVTQNMQRELGDLLVDIHGQHAHQSLLKPNHQLSLIDELITDKKTLASLQSTAKRYHQITKSLRQLETDTQQRKERVELIQYQLQELSEISLLPENILEIEQEHSRVANVQGLTFIGESVRNDLFENDFSVSDKLSDSLEQLKQGMVNDTNLRATVDLVANASTALEEARMELRDYLDSLDINPERLNELDQSISQLHLLSRKHRVDRLQLHNVESDLTEELEQLKSQQADSYELKQEQHNLKSSYHEISKKLSRLRKKASKSLQISVTERMQTLGMEGGVFEVEWSECKEGFSQKGAEVCEFIVSANPGQPLKPLAKVASGGELSRISLAIQVITAETRITPCLIFDEVDVGIGGQTADTVGRMLSNISNLAQVICVTHQPQVAARGDHHLQASKHTVNKQTQTQLELLNKQKRVDEIARMVGGQEITQSTLKHAKELLAN